MNEKVEIGGNRFLLWLGNHLTKLGTKWSSKGSKLVVTNPTCILYSPYLLVINFTVNNSEKYTLTLQGDYKEKYTAYKKKLKETNVESDGEPITPITITEMFILIKHKQSEWFLKE